MRETPEILAARADVAAAVAKFNEAKREGEEAQQRLRAAQAAMDRAFPPMTAHQSIMHYFATQDRLAAERGGFPVDTSRNGMRLPSRDR